MEEGGGVGWEDGQGCIRLFPLGGKGSSERRQSFKGGTESSLSDLVFCAIKKTRQNKYNLKTSYMTLKAHLGQAVEIPPSTAEQC